MEDSVFTKIIKGEIPCHKIYEDETTLAFLDIHPIQPGHTLVIPKKQIEFIWDLGVDDYHALMETARKVALRLREIFPDKGYVGVHIEGLEVAHVHIKVFPFDTDEEFRRHPNMDAEPDHVSLAEIAARLAF